MVERKKRKTVDKQFFKIEKYMQIHVESNSSYDRLLSGQTGLRGALGQSLCMK